MHQSHWRWFSIVNGSNYCSCLMSSCNCWRWLFFLKQYFELNMNFRWISNVFSTSCWIIEIAKQRHFQPHQSIFNGKSCHAYNKVNICCIDGWMDGWMDVYNGIHCIFNSFNFYCHSGISTNAFPRFSFRFYFFFEYEPHSKNVSFDILQSKTLLFQKEHFFASK